MKKYLLFISISILFSSCATLFGGPLDHCQTTKPMKGQKRRSIRIIPFILDTPFGWITDFATGAIYKPCSGPAPGTNTQTKK